MRLRPCGVFALVLAIAALLSALVGAEAPRQAGAASPQAPVAARCRVEGHVTSGAVALPGVSVVVQAGDVVKAATSTDIDGKFTILFTPNATYNISAELTSFTRAERDVTLVAPPCDTTVDFQL